MNTRATSCLTRSGMSGLEAIAPMLPVKRTSRPPSSSAPQLSRPASGSRSSLSQLQPEGSSLLYFGHFPMAMAQHRPVCSLSPWPSRPATPASQVTSRPTTSGRPAAAVPNSVQAVQRHPPQPQSQRQQQQLQQQQRCTTLPTIPLVAHNQVLSEVCSSPAP